jgi:hypothetical protein
MFARGLLSFYPASCLASHKFSLNSIIPTRLSRAPFERDARPSLKSNHSRTSAIPGGGGIYRFPYQTNSPCSLHKNPTLCPLSFQSLAHSFIFHSTPIFRLPSSFRTLAPKTGVYPCLVIAAPQAPSSCSNPLPPVTCHQPLFTGRWPLVAGHFFPYTPTEVTPQ